MGLHLDGVFRQHGPGPAHWLMAFERMNGRLGRECFSGRRASIPYEAVAKFLVRQFCSQVVDAWTAASTKKLALSETADAEECDGLDMPALVLSDLRSDHGTFGKHLSSHAAAHRLCASTKQSSYVARLGLFRTLMESPLFGDSVFGDDDRVFRRYEFKEDGACKSTSTLSRFLMGDGGQEPDETSLALRQSLVSYMQNFALYHTTNDSGISDRWAWRLWMMIEIGDGHGD